MSAHHSSFSFAIGGLALTTDSTPSTPPFACRECGSPTTETEVPVTFWIGTELKIVEGVPARVCDRCQARHFSEEVEQKLASLVASGAPEWRAPRQIAVPVFAYEDIADFSKPQPQPYASGDSVLRSQAQPAPRTDPLEDVSDPAKPFSR